MEKDITIRLAQQPEADALLGRSPLAALVGMLLDQQVPMEWAFSGPWTIAQRLGSEDLDAHAIAAGGYGQANVYRSAADITGPESLAKVRAHKQEMKAAAKAAKAAGSGS
ncbi:hypothetical protein [Streptomyces sp. NPDC090112]|uniref:hypothetical protein n=1 Tax=Streptomyces sp. NPDC090112 TaxID=3365949 RepID=UPI0037FE4624